MKTSLHRTFPVLFIFLVCIALAIGTFHSFNPARAISITTLTPTATAMITGASLTPTSDQEAGTDENTVPPEVTPDPGLIGADTTSIILMAIVLVVIILAGMAWGRRKPPGKKLSG
jgi:hypothetical protein